MVPVAVPGTGWVEESGSVPVTGSVTGSVAVSVADSVSVPPEVGRGRINCAEPIHSPRSKLRPRTIRQFSYR